MTTTSFDTALRRVTITSITGYQRYLSPRKGFSCAHRRLHGAESCSAYIKRVIGENGVFTARPLIRQRFADCRKAAHVLKAQQAEDGLELLPEAGALEVLDVNLPGPVKKRGLLDNCNLSDGCDVMDCLSCDGIPDCSAPDCGSCDTPSCDCGSSVLMLLLLS